MRAFFGTMLMIVQAGISTPAGAESWKTAWTGSVQGPYPIGNPTAQPDLQFAFPSAETGASDESFRMIVRPDIWGKSARVRFSNVFGTKPLKIDAAYAGVQMSGAALLPGSNQAMTFNGQAEITIPAGQSVWSDRVALASVAEGNMAGRKLAVSFHVVGDSGPMTWHAKGLTTSYLSGPGTGARTSMEDERSYPFSTTSWFFLDAVDMDAPASTRVIVAFGDSITDGTDSTINGDDRWPDVFSRRLHSVLGDSISVVNTGIGGNQVVGPADYSPQNPYSGGPAATQRLDRDILELSGVSSVIILEGINDFSKVHAAPEAVEDGIKQIVARLRKEIPHVIIMGATLTPTLNSTNGDAGLPDVDEKRRAYNTFIRNCGLFDAVTDFDKVTIDEHTGAMKVEFQPNSSIGGPGDGLHPNRAGYLAMGSLVDLSVFGAKGKE